jgi:hypothetical protein
MFEGPGSGTTIVGKVEKGKTTQLVYKDLEKVRGYLCHLSLTYDILAPYLKGLHLVLAQHLDQRDAEGWKLTEKAWHNYVDSKVNNGDIVEQEAKELLRQSGESTNASPVCVFLLNIW